MRGYGGRESGVRLWSWVWHCDVCSWLTLGSSLHLSSLGLGIWLASF